MRDFKEFGRRALYAATFGVALGAVGLAAGPAVSQDKAEPFTIRVQNYPSTLSTGVPIMWVAKEKGFCAEHGLNCELVDLGSAPLGLQALASGSIDVNQAASDALIVAKSKGFDIKMIGSPNPPMIWTFVGRKGLDLPNRDKGYPAVMQDLKGKRLGVTARGSASENFVRALLAGAGMSPDDATFVAVGPATNAYQAMVANQIDTHMGFEPFQSLCVAQGVCDVLVDLRKGEGPAEVAALNGSYGTYSVSTKFLEKNPEVVEAFLEAVTDSLKWLKNEDNFDEFLALAHDYVNFGDIENGDALLEQVLREQIPGMGVGVDPASLQASADFVLKIGLIDEPLDISTLLYDKVRAPGTGQE